MIRLLWFFWSCRVCRAAAVPARFYSWCLAPTCIVFTAVTSVAENAIPAPPASHADVVYSVVDVSSGAVLASKEALKPVKPASVMKIVTTGAALERLGPSYQFKTEFFLIQAGKGRAASLGVKGYGDPDLTIEALWIAARALRVRGISEVADIYVDQSAYGAIMPRKGQSAYQAAVTPLALNFNVATLYVCPEKAGRAARVSLDPWEATHRFIGQIKSLQGGRSSFYVDEVRDERMLSYQLRGGIRAGKGCSTVLRSVANPSRYFGDVFGEVLGAVGIRYTGRLREAPVPQGAQRVYEHRSKPLRMIVDGLNRYSNNFVAEQLTYVMGRSADGGYEHSRGTAVMTAFLRRVGAETTSLKIVDGSGLSHMNRLSARSVTRVLTYMFRDSALRPEFVSSLSVAGRDGTLKKRKTLGAHGVVRGKTGTLNGVKTLAGYVSCKSGKTAGFAILQNAVTSSRLSEKWEVSFLRLVQQQC